MLKFIDVNYYQLKQMFPKDLYKIRKKVFYDRLNWNVSCTQDMEFDSYDKPGTHYLIGIFKKNIICSVRFIKSSKENMITHTFHEYFKDVDLPKDQIESSRFFVDKSNCSPLSKKGYPVSNILFLAMINYAIKSGYNGIYTIISRAMLTILRRSGWQVSILKEVYISEKEYIYLVYLPANENDQLQIAQNIHNKTGIPISTLVSWPITLMVSEQV